MKVDRLGREIKFGINASHWKGGKPKCLDCKKQLVAYSSKRCHQCFGKIVSILKKGTKQPWAKQNLPSRIGYKHSEITKQKISLAHIGMKKPWNKNPDKIRRSLRRRTPSGLEQRLIQIIEKYHLPYKFVGNGKFFIEKKNPDFINVNGEKKAIEVYSRKHKELFMGGIDIWKKERQAIFGKYGWKIIFIEDWQTNNEKEITNLLKGGYQNS